MRFLGIQQGGKWCAVGVVVVVVGFVNWPDCWIVRSAFSPSSSLLVGNAASFSLYSWLCLEFWNTLADASDVASCSGAGTCLEKLPIARDGSTRREQEERANKR